MVIKLSCDDVMDLQIKQLEFDALSSVLENVAKSNNNSALHEKAGYKALELRCQEACKEFHETQNLLISKVSEANGICINRWYIDFANCTLHTEEDANAF